MSHCGSRPLVPVPCPGSGALSANTGQWPVGFSLRHSLFPTWNSVLSRGVKRACTGEQRRNRRNAMGAIGGEKGVSVLGL